MGYETLQTDTSIMSVLASLLAERSEGGSISAGAGLRKINSEFKRTRHITNVLFCYSFVIQ